MNTANRTPILVPSDDHKTRRRAAVAVGKAYIGHPLWWFGVAVFTSFSGLLFESAWRSHRSQLGAGPTLLSLGCAVFFLAFGVTCVSAATAWTIYRAKELYYLDTGQARAALATRPDTRRRQLPGDVQAHTFGAWPRRSGAGSALGDWVLQQVHARGGRLTATALPGTARAYKERGMVADGRTAFVLTRVASKPRTQRRLRRGR